MNSIEESAAIKFVEKLGDAMYAGGAPCDYGIDERDLDHYIQIAQNIDPIKPIRALKQWCWWDLDVADSIREALLSKKGLRPAMINSHDVIYDSSHRFSNGSWVRTSPLLTLHQNTIFESKNSLYILVGPGSRKTVGVDIALSFF